MEREGGTVFPPKDTYNFSFDEKLGFSVFLQERCKRIYFIRHAEGYHNDIERITDFKPPSSILLVENSGWKYMDAKLTPRGEEQCAKLKEEVRGHSVWARLHPLNLQLVVVSPLTRTLQTAFLSLGRADEPGAPPFVATELCRERIADFTCDRRRTITELRKDFPGVDFSEIESEEDEMFFNSKEDDEICKKRTVEFLQWLSKRPETRIAVVTHSIFLKNLFEQFGFGLAKEDVDALHKFPTNAEMRGIMLCAHKKF
jgi:broad specificity phosphatase PhoE